MKKIFFLLLAAVFCLSCAAHKIPPATTSAHKIPLATATWDSNGSGTVVAPANEVVRIVSSLNELPLQCAEHASEILAAAPPGDNNFVNIDCSPNAFHYKMRPKPKIAVIIVYNETYDKGYRANISTPEGSTILNDYIPPRTYRIIERPEGTYNFRWEADPQEQHGSFDLVALSTRKLFKPFPDKPNQEYVDYVVRLGWDKPVIK